eukprot:s4047_g1.t1
MVGVTLWRGRELAGKLSKRLAYLFGAGQEADPPTFVRLVLKRFRVCPVRPASPMCMKALRSQTDSSIDVMRRVWHSRTLDRRGVTVGHGPAVSKLPLSLHMPTRCLGGLRCLAHSSRADLEERGILQESPADEPWTVRVPDEEGLLGELSAVTVAKAAAAIQSVGFAVLRGASVLRSGELCAAQAEADEALEEIKATAQNLGLEPLAPWATPKPTPGAGNLFRFQEASSFSSGRLDMTLEDSKPSGPLATRQDLLRLCEVLFDTDCQLASRGAFWNFPGSGREHWHRDGLMPLLTVVTAARQYPSDAGFMRLQPFTQTGAIDEDSESCKEPKAAAGESERVAATLRPGELLLFLYSAKHAAVPNFSEFDRCLLYSVYGPKGISDDLNIKDTAPSLLSFSKSEASMLSLMAKNLK